MKTRLDLILAARYPDLSRARLQTLIAEGAVTIDGQPVLKPAAKINPDVSITVTFPPPPPPPDELIPLDLALPILYEDPDLLIIDKPPGLVTHPAPGHDQDTLVNALITHCPTIRDVGSPLRPGIVHRLDSDTSGCLVIAKTDLAYRSLSAQFAAHTPQKLYLALTWGVPSPPSGTLTAALGRDPRNRKRQALLAETHGGRPAITHYSVLTSSPVAALLALRIETGRTHQIRVHLSSLLHCPICGDPLYGGRRKTTPPCPHMPPRQMLHAYRLTLRHPATDVPLTATAPLPPDFLLALSLLLPDFSPSALPTLLSRLSPTPS